MQRRFSNPDMPTDDFCRRAIYVGFEGAEGEQKLSIYICRLSEEHNVTLNINIRLSMWLKCWLRALYWKTIMLLRKTKQKTTTTYTQKTHSLKVSHHECVRIELLLWMVYRVVFHAKRHSNVMHALSVDRCPRCWKGNVQTLSQLQGNAVTEKNLSFIAVTYSCYYYTCGWTTDVVKLPLPNCV